MCRLALPVCRAAAVAWRGLFTCSCCMCVLQLSCRLWLRHRTDHAPTQWCVVGASLVCLARTCVWVLKGVSCPGCVLFARCVLPWACAVSGGPACMQPAGGMLCVLSQLLQLTLCWHHGTMFTALTAACCVFGCLLSLAGNALHSSEALENAKNAAPDRDVQHALSVLQFWLCACSMLWLAVAYWLRLLLPGAHADGPAGLLKFDPGHAVNMRSTCGQQGRMLSPCWSFCRSCSSSRRSLGHIALGCRRTFGLQGPSAPCVVAAWRLPAVLGG